MRPARALSPAAMPSAITRLWLFRSTASDEAVPVALDDAGRLAVLPAAVLAMFCREDDRTSLSSIFMLSSMRSSRPYIDPPEPHFKVFAPTLEFPGGPTVQTAAK